jgi:hypothetical protein
MLQQLAGLCMLRLALEYFFSLSRSSTSRLQSVSTYIRCVVHVSAANYSQRTCRNFTLQSERGDIILLLSSPLCPRSSEVPV